MTSTATTQAVQLRRERDKRNHQRKLAKESAMQREVEELKERISWLEEQIAMHQAQKSTLTWQQQVTEQQLQKTTQALADSHRVLQDQELHFYHQIEEVKKKSQKEHTVCENLTSVLCALPPNSPLRRPLLSEVTRGLAPADIKEMFRVSDSTIRRLDKERTIPKGHSSLWLRYRPAVHRRRWGKEKEGVCEILDDIAPMPSARVYRICTTTKGKFYSEYRMRAQRQKRHVFSQTYLLHTFLRRRHYSCPWSVRHCLHEAQMKVALQKVERVISGNTIVAKKLTEEEKQELKKEEEKVQDEAELEEEKGRMKLYEEGEHIHWVKDATSCKHCRRFVELKGHQERRVLSKEEEEEYKEKELHVALIQAQRGTYQVMKLRFEEGGYAPGTILVLQDFTQLVTAKGGFSQDLILVWYEYNCKAKDLERHTCHYVAGEKGKGKRYKADMQFVVAVWEKLLSSDWAHVRVIIALSDGCGRQWKLTRFSMYLMQLSQRRSSLEIDYHFFPSCHGYSICDVIGAQGQRTIINFELDTKAAIVTPPELVTVLRRTKNHHAEVAPIPIDPVPGEKVNSRKGIKQWHRVQYQVGRITAWRASTDEENRIAPLGRFQEGCKANKSLVFTAEEVQERRNNKNKPQPALPHADTSFVKQRSEAIAKKRKHSVLF
jgi:hypothetical protein